MKGKNFQDHSIPDPKIMVSAAERLLHEIPELPRFSFTDFLSQSLDKKWKMNKSFFQEYQSINFPTISSNRHIKGLYVFFEKSGHPCYVGISRNIPARLKNHFVGKTHNSATLVYLIGRHDLEREGKNSTHSRSEIPMERFKTTYDMLRKEWKIVFSPIECDYTLHFAEVYVAAGLRTHWNTFTTH